MRMPGELLDLWIRFHTRKGGNPLQIGYVEMYTLEKLKDPTAAPSPPLMSQPTTRDPPLLTFERRVVTNTRRKCRVRA